MTKFISPNGYVVTLITKITMGLLGSIFLTKVNKNTTLKKKKTNKADIPFFTCGDLGHFDKDCPK